MKISAILSLVWFLGILPLAGFLLLRGDPRSGSLSFFPDSLSNWLDSHYDLRTLVMAFGAAIVPSLLLVGWPSLRRVLLAAILLFLLAGELFQIWLPLRTFSWIDIGFSVLGVAVAELLAVLLKGAGSRLRGEGFRLQESGGRNQESGNPSAGFSPQQLAQTEEKLTPDACPLTPSSQSHSTHMKVLIYGLNYAPELTGIGRYTGEMGPWLQKSGVDVRVVTTPPYYPHWKIADGYRKFWFQNEVVEEVPVWRCPFYVPAKPTTMKRLVHLGSFAVIGFVGLFRHLLWRPDWVFMVEPASMTVPGGLIFAKVAGAKSWLHVQDFEMEAMLGLSQELGERKDSGGRGQEVEGEKEAEARSQGAGDRGQEAVDESVAQKRGGGLKGKLLGWAAGLEAWLKRRFDRTSSISQVMMGKLGERGIPEEKISFFPNWVDIDFMSPGEPKRNFKKEWGMKDEDCFVLYSGNIGRKQGLEMVLEVAERLQGSGSLPDGPEEKRGGCDCAFHFVIVGEGAAKDELVAEAKERGLTKVQFHPLQPYEDLPDLLRSADVHLVIQKKGAADAVLPSKLTSILAVGGNAVITAEAETELGRLDLNFPGMVSVIEPERADALVEVLREKKAVFAEEDFNRQARAYAEDYLERDAVLRKVQLEMEDGKS